MEELDNSQLSELVLQKIYPVYVINEESKIIVFTNEIMDQIAGKSLVGENCYEAFFGDKNLNLYSPEERPIGERYQWEYFEPKQNKLYKVCDLWFEQDKKRYRAGIAADASDIMGLNRSVVDYLSLMKQLSELQIEIIREKKNALPLLMTFFMKHFKANRIIFSYEENNELITLICDDRGVRQTSEIYGGDGEYDEIHILGNVYKFWAENIGNPEAWADDRGFILSVAGLYLENELLWKQVEWENTHDRATNLFNRACFHNNQASIYSKLEQVGIVFADIDNLKRVNDECGHEMGDRLIKKMADVFLSIHDRRVDAYRMGGDEFMLVCSEFDSKDLEVLIEDISLKLDTINESIKMPKISISVGYANSKAPFNIEELMKIADERMYVEKRRKKIAQP